MATLTILAKLAAAVEEKAAAVQAAALSRRRAYGTPMAQEIESLREVRDAYMLNKRCGFCVCGHVLSTESCGC